MDSIMVILLCVVVALELFMLSKRGVDNGGAEKRIKDDISRIRMESGEAARLSREEMSKNIKIFEESMVNQFKTVSELQRHQLESFAKQLENMSSGNERRLESMRETVGRNLTDLRKENSERLEQMRETVDEKLHSTLEKRLSQSFGLISEQLESVYKGLGEMKKLASGVDDLKRVFTNVKTRGTWGEVQLGALLSQVLASEQFAENVATKQGSADRVEFAIKLPGRDGEDSGVWLPIDAKFPQEDYLRLLDAFDNADAVAAEEAKKSLERRIKAEARNIHDKYVDPPNTTDFGIMFLPIEGLYAEVLRMPGLADNIQREYRVVITGPTTLSALLNSLQMGFRTLAIEKRSSEVWKLLGAVKTQFSQFGTLLDKTHKKLQEASNTIEDASRKTRTIERKLKDVSSLSPGESAGMLGDSVDTED